MSELKTYLKPGDRVFCHKGMICGFGDEFELTPGKWYTIKNVYMDFGVMVFSIKNDTEHNHVFQIDGENPDMSYKTWFYTDKEIREKQIDILLEYE